MLGCDFDAAITGIGDTVLIGMGKQKEGETNENDDGRYCDNAERDEVEHAGFRCRGALTWGIGERTRCFGRLWPRVSGCISHRELPCSSSNDCFLSIRRCISRALSAVHPRIQSAT